jgi:hypothetical protein
MDWDVFIDLLPVTSPICMECERRMLFRRQYGSVPQHQQRKFWLFGVGRTPTPRRFAATLLDRTFMHQPNALHGEW